MTELQSRLLEMFQWFHELCQENGLRYYAIGGTALGAMRHKGFIPWDDDIDVGMPRPDYEKLAQLMEEYSHKYYVLETPSAGGEDYFSPFSKLYDVRTTLIENTRTGIKRGIFLDIFPLDGIGNSERSSKLNYYPIHFKRLFFAARATCIEKERNIWKSIVVVAAKSIPDFILDNKKLLLDIDRNCKKRDFDKCTWVGNLLGAWKFKELVPKELFGEPTLYEFEGGHFYGPEKADEYLTCIYGNWRQLPPVEKQVSHHDFIEIDLHKSYLEE